MARELEARGHALAASERMERCGEIKTSLEDLLKRLIEVEGRAVIPRLTDCDGDVRSASWIGGSGLRLCRRHPTHWLARRGLSKHGGVSGVGVASISPDPVE